MPKKCSDQGLYTNQLFYFYQKVYLYIQFVNYVLAEKHSSCSGKLNVQLLGENGSKFHMEQTTASSKEIARSHHFHRITEQPRLERVSGHSASTLSRVYQQVAQDHVQLDFSYLQWCSPDSTISSVIFFPKFKWNFNLLHLHYLALSYYGSSHSWLDHYLHCNNLFLGSVADSAFQHVSKPASNSCWLY